MREDDRDEFAWWTIPLWLFVLLVCVLSLFKPAHAENALVVNVCGTLPLAYPVGSTQQPTVDINGKTCTNATGGGGGAVTLAAGAVSAGAYVAGALVDGAETTIGALADAACATDNGTCSLQALVKRTNQRITTLNTTLGTPAQAGAATPAGQASIGNVGGLTKTVCVAPTVTNGTYAANVVVGGLLTYSNLFTSTGHGVIQSVALDFTTAQTVGFKLYPFRGSPTNTAVWTDHSTPTNFNTSADIFLEDQPIQLSNPDSGLAAAMTNYGAIGLGQAYNPAGTSGFFVLVPTATTASLGGTASVVQVCVTVLQDS